MAEPFLSEIRIFSFNFPPKGWAFCNGQLLPINQNQALFSLLGTTYGGDGRVNFALPNLRGNVPIHMGNGFTLGQRGGQPAHTVTMSEMPAHTHSVNVNTTTTGRVNIPTNNYPADSSPSNTYVASPNTTFAPQVVSLIGGSQPHNNMQPSLVLNMCIALQGIFPSQT